MQTRNATLPHFGEVAVEREMQGQTVFVFSVSQNVLETITSYSFATSYLRNLLSDPSIFKARACNYCFQEE